MALWAWLLEPRLAASLAVFGALIGQLIAAFSLRRRWDWRALLPFLAGGLAGLPLGLWLLPRLDVPLFKFLLGAMLVIVCPLMFFAHRLPHVRGGSMGDAVAGGAGGVMSGLGGFSGVAPTLWCTVRGFEKDKQRAVIQNFNLSIQVVTFASYVGTGIITADMLPLFAIAAPAILVPSLLGARLYLGISEQGFRKVVLGLLSLTGVALLATSAPAVLGRWFAS